jgi:hypothetical protein
VKKGEERMKYTCKVIKINPSIEEEVTIEVNNKKLTVFSTVCPYPLQEGLYYPILISFTILDELNIKESKSVESEIIQLGKSDKYLIRGILEADHIDAGIQVIDEDDYFSEYVHLYGKTVEIVVDRIEVEFLNE